MLEVRHLHLAYGYLEVVHGVSLRVDDGEFVAVLGANGAGKSTLLRACAGQIRPRSGQIRFDGHDLTRVAPHQAVRLGIAYATEGRRIFQQQSVRANLEIGSYPLPRRRTRAQALIDRMFALFPVLERKAQLSAGSLSGGERQMLAIAQALMSDPRLLILDEPSAGLAPLMIDQVFRALDELRADGLSLLLSEQTVEQSLALCDRGYVLDAGNVVLSDSAAILRDDADLRAVYIGSLGHGARTEPSLAASPPRSVHPPER